LLIDQDQIDGGQGAGRRRLKLNERTGAMKDAVMESLQEIERTIDCPIRDEKIEVASETRISYRITACPPTMRQGSFSTHARFTISTMTFTFGCAGSW